ncbi:MAG TPA: wax ester/triacylglycerol synthase family O-acyltransferase, partial [Thermoanaerobaculia bacterium]|nr:wax ester/triacylglycerol synthase family O-acyltransferase [Thermoanaerobaculia bacterium]
MPEDSKPPAALPASGAARHRLSPVDLAWLRMDDPTNLMMITGVLTFDEPLPADRLLAVMHERLATIPRFRQRVVGSYTTGRLFWEEDPAFDVSRH